MRITCLAVFGKISEVNLQLFYQILLRVDNQFLCWYMNGFTHVKTFRPHISNRKIKLKIKEKIFHRFLKIGQYSWKRHMWGAFQNGRPPPYVNEPIYHGHQRRNRIPLLGLWDYTT